LCVVAGEVEFLNEEEDAAEADSNEAKELAKEVADLMRSTIRLNVKVRDTHARMRACTHTHTHTHTQSMCIAQGGAC